MLAIEIDDSKDNFLEAIGTATYSNSKPTVSSYFSELRTLTLNEKIVLQTNIKLDETVFCDPDRIGQVLSNLIKNSIDFVPDNGNRKIIVRVEKQQDNDNDYDDDFKMALFTVLE